MPILVPFKAPHLVALQPRDEVGPDGWAQARQKETMGPAFTLLDGDRILGCAGVVIAWPGVGLGWVVLTEEIRPYGLWLTRHVRCILRDIMRAYRLHRVEAAILCGNERNLRWAEAFGFRPEGGIARAYTSDRRDAVRYQLMRDNP